MTLKDYPGVETAVFPFIFAYREEKPPEPKKVNTTDSGFSTFPFEPDISFNPLRVSGY